LVFGKEGKSIA